MGLDITAYASVQRIGDYSEAFDYPEGQDFLYPFPAGDSEEFAARAEGLDGIYEVTGRIDFRAGSYSGYNRWREELSQVIHGVAPSVLWSNADDWRGKPFYELIHFADNEGTLGPKTCAKLAKDFTDHLESVQSNAESDYFLEKYKEWMNAFSVAANNGAVRFH